MPRAWKLHRQCLDRLEVPLHAVMGQPWRGERMIARTEEGVLFWDDGAYTGREAEDGSPLYDVGGARVEFWRVAKHGKWYRAPDARYCPTPGPRYYVIGGGADMHIACADERWRPRTDFSVCSLEI